MMPLSEPGHMPRVFALGESLLDLIYDGNDSFLAVPGGSVLNTAVSLGRLNVPVYLLSECGGDAAGDLLTQFLAQNNVDASFVQRHSGYRTSLALAFLDEQKNAAYSFYHDIPESVNYTNIPDFYKADYLLFGSYYAVKNNRRKRVIAVVDSAIRNGSTILYDPNIRKAHSHEMESLSPSIAANIRSASIVKGSVEDFEFIFGTRDPDEVYSKVRHDCRTLIITAGSEPVHLFTPAFHLAVDTPAIQPVSTVGAGDSFSAGLLYSLASGRHAGKNPEILNETEWEKVISNAINFASQACLSAENYISLQYAGQVQKQKK